MGRKLAERHVRSRACVGGTRIFIYKQRTQEAGTVTYFATALYLHSVVDMLAMLGGAPHARGDPFFGGSWPIGCVGRKIADRHVRARAYIGCTRINIINRTYVRYNILLW